MKTEDIGKVFLKVKADKEKIDDVASKFVSYPNIPNFLNGKKKCDQCKGEMELIPIGQPFKRVEGGKILVDVIEQHMVLSHVEPITMWACKQCPNAITKAKTGYAICGPNAGIAC